MNNNGDPPHDAGPSNERAGPSPQVPCPGTFGRYHVEALLAEGGMGSVYLAYDPNFDIRVTLKVPKPHLLRIPKTLDLFSREAKVLARLHHPHLCRIFDVSEIDGIHYIAMAYVEGMPLRREHAPSPDAAADLVRTLALALAVVHREGVIHRDLKPSNILINARNEPVVIDFGLALNVSPRAAREEDYRIQGTPSYMAPEQADGKVKEMGPRSDVFSLGVILYELLAGRKPFHAATGSATLAMIASPDIAAEPPSQHLPGLDPRLDAICLKALAKPVEARFPNMEAFANDLVAYLRAGSATPTPGEPRMAPPRPSGFWARWRRWLAGPDSSLLSTVEMVEPPDSGRVARDRVRFTFVGHGEVAPPLIERQDRLYLDVGEGLRPAVIDHHQQPGPSQSATSAVLAHPDLVRLALKPWRSDDAPFTVVLHRDPDIDAVSATLVALAILCDGSPPEGSAALAGYVDAIDRGEPAMSLERPFSPYSALMQVGHRLSLTRFESRDERWTALVESGMKVLTFALAEAVRTNQPLAAVDAFDCPGLFRQLDREEVLLDIDRYQAKLSDPASLARRTILELPRAGGGSAAVEALLVRNVQGDDDVSRCIFFKDWARTDRARSPESGGFVALSVSEAGPTEGTLRSILSVRPDAGVTLAGLAGLLEAAESARRRERFGVDDRMIDLSTGLARDPRPGYPNADPWYDGRAHGFTIVDAPRQGSWLSADEVETLFLRFGGRGPDEAQKNY